MAAGLDRFMDQLIKATDELDGKNPDHDIIKERIAAAMAAAQVRRVQLMEEAQKMKLKALVAN
jgi:hypothetical protein